MDLTGEQLKILQIRKQIFTWRGNGDGINTFANDLIEDCFIRTQEDSTYVNG